MRKTLAWLLTALLATAAVPTFADESTPPVIIIAEQAGTQMILSQHPSALVLAMDQQSWPSVPGLSRRGNRLAIKDQANVLIFGGECFAGEDGWRLGAPPSPSPSPAPTIWIETPAPRTLVEPSIETVTISTLEPTVISITTLPPAEEVISISIETLAPIPTSTIRPTPTTPAITYVSTRHPSIATPVPRGQVSLKVPIPTATDTPAQVLSKNYLRAKYNAEIAYEELLWFQKQLLLAEQMLQEALAGAKAARDKTYEQDYSVPNYFSDVQNEIIGWENYAKWAMNYAENMARAVTDSAKKCQDTANKFREAYIARSPKVTESALSHSVIISNAAKAAASPIDVATSLKAAKDSYTQTMKELGAAETQLAALSNPSIPSSAAAQTAQKTNNLHIDAIEVSQKASLTLQETDVDKLTTGGRANINLLDGANVARLFADHEARIQLNPGSLIGQLFLRGNASAHGLPDDQVIYNNFSMSDSEHQPTAAPAPTSQEDETDNSGTGFDNSNDSGGGVPNNPGGNVDPNNPGDKEPQQPGDPNDVGGKEPKPPEDPHDVGGKEPKPPEDPLDVGGKEPKPLDN